MAEPSLKKRIWGWYFFDWASQPYHTLLTTFIFGPFFVTIATAYFVNLGVSESIADAEAQSLWSRALTIAGLVIGFGAPILGAVADTSGNRIQWVGVFSIMFVLGSAALWWTDPGGGNLWWPLLFYCVGIIGAEWALIFVNAQLPTLGTREEVGKLSGDAFAFGYAGGLVSLILALLLFVEHAGGNTTLIGIAPLFGLNPELQEGTRFIGPLVALWFAIFMIPYFRWVREVRAVRDRPSISVALSNLADSIRRLPARPSLSSFLVSSMLFRDALNGLYGFGGVYAALVLEWDLTKIGIFGIVAALAAAIFTYVGGFLDRRFGPKPIIRVCILGLVVVCIIVVGMDRTQFFGVPIAEGSPLPDYVFYACGVLIGGLGGILQSVSRTMMVRHTTAEEATESFGLYGFTGKATAFLAPLLIWIATEITQSARLGISPLIVLFLLGLVLLRWVHPDGDRAETWSPKPSPHS